MTRAIHHPAAAASHVVACVLALFGATRPAHAQCVDLPGCVLVWSDEFDGSQLDPTKWETMIGDGTDYGLPAGWGNGELQYYRAENATVADGHLTITAKEEPFEGYDYTSARIRSVDRGDWTYGRIEMRARMPIGRGLWAAFWMLPTDPEIYGVWAASGEIDIVEHIGSDAETIFGTLHYGGPWPNNVFSGNDYSLASGTFHDDFHEFAIEWEFGEIRWYVDGELYSTKTDWFSTGGPFPAPFDVDFHNLLNVAVGGSLPGPPDDMTEFPQDYVIDYVRVYQIPNEPPVVTITSPGDGANLEPGSDLTITADASDDGAIRAVEFFQEAARLGEDSTPPYEWTVPRIGEGCYTLRAEVRDDLGVKAVSDEVGIMVGGACSPAPYLITPTRLPGRLEVENYDLGGQDIAYDDIDPTNNGMSYRPDEGVDLEGTLDTGGGFNLGWTVFGEWVSYTVDVFPPGIYDIEVRVASEAVGGTFSLEFGGVDRTGNVSFDATGGWQNWTTVRIPGVALEAGLQTLRFLIAGGAFNVNWIEVVDPPAPNEGVIVFDNMEHGDPPGNGWFLEPGEIGSGTIAPENGDLPPRQGGDFAIRAEFETPGPPGSLGGFGRVFPVDVSSSEYFSFLIHPRADESYTLQINLRDDDNGDDAIPDVPDGADDEFQYDCVVSPVGPCARSGGPWQLVSIPLAAFFDDNSLHFGGNGVFDPQAVGAGGNGQLVEVVFSVVSNSGSDASFTTDFWTFSNTPSPPSTGIFDDFEDGSVRDWEFFGGDNAGGGGGLFSDRPAEGDFYLGTGWGGAGSDSGFYGGFFKNLDNNEQFELPPDPWFNVWVLNQSDATVDQYSLEFTIREDLDGNGWTDGEEDSFRFDTVFTRADFDDEWRLLSGPVSEFTDLMTGGDGTFDGMLDEFVVVIGSVEGDVDSSVEVDLDYLVFTTGGPLLGLGASGVCPGQVTLELTGATPGGEVAFVWSTATGEATIPGGACGGTELGLAAPQLLFRRDANLAGRVTTTGSPPAEGCGAFLQVVDMTTCLTSGVIQLP